MIFHVEVNIEPAQAQQMFGEEDRAAGREVQYAGGGPEQPSAMAQAASALRGCRESPGAPIPRDARRPGRLAGNRGSPGRSTWPPWSRPRRKRSVATTPAGAAQEEVQEVPALRLRDAPDRPWGRWPLAVVAAAAPTLAGLVEAPAGSAKPTVTISGRAYVFNHSETPIAGATIRVRELDATAITDANGDYELTVPDETLARDIEPPAGYHQIDLQTFHTRGKAIENELQTPADAEYYGLAALKTRCRSGPTADRAVRDRDHCVGAERARGRLRDLQPARRTGSPARGRAPSPRCRSRSTSTTA